MGAPKMDGSMQKNVTHNCSGSLRKNDANPDPVLCAWPAVVVEDIVGISKNWQIDCYEQTIRLADCHHCQNKNGIPNRQIHNLHGRSCFFVSHYSSDSYLSDCT